MLLNNINKFCNFFFLFLLFSNIVVFSIYAKERIPHTLKEVGVSENIGEQVPLDLVFTNELGEKVTLQDYFQSDKSIILNLAYYTCPMLCHLVATGLHTSLTQLPFNIGGKYEVISLSIDPGDTIENAKAFENKYASSLKGEKPKDYWHFLVGDQENISKLAEAVGFRYRFNSKTQQFAHSAAIMFLTPEGKLKRYLYGIEYKPLDVRLGILESIDRNKISGVERVLLFCYNYDPQGKKYVIYAYNVMRIGGLFTVIFIILMIYYFLREEKKVNFRNEDNS
ncbi:SCO family protein [Candidatus Marinamargulisbacteria bacterium SCGC AAA071-K20]|nr:SCO family protein [Candidatus Marinamargulisbacteria bacterium SCGC AAA071-K20]